MLRKTIVDKNKKYKLIKSCKSQKEAEELVDKLESKNGRSRRFCAIVDHINMPLYEGSKIRFKRFKVYIPVEWRK